MYVPSPADVVRRRQAKPLPAVVKEFLGVCLRLLHAEYDGTNEVRVAAGGQTAYTVAGALAALEAAGWACRVEKGAPDDVLVIGRVTR